MEILHSVFKKCIRNKKMKLLMVGLDAVGKTTILYKLKLTEKFRNMPTIGFNVETVQYKNINFNIWDIGGGDKIRPLWKHYFQNTHGILYVVDSNDPDRLSEAKEALHYMLEQEESKGVCLLVLANKQDFPNALSTLEITEKLGLSDIENRRWSIQATCAVNRAGLYEGLDWMSEEFLIMNE